MSAVGHDSEEERTDRERRPPGRVLHTQFGLVAAILVWAYSYPGGPHVLLLTIAGGWLLVLVPAWLFTGVRSIRSEQHPRRLTARLAIAPLIGLVTVLTVAVGLPLRVRWELSQPSFESIVETTDPMANPIRDWRDAAVDAPARIGLYRITKVEQYGDAVIFHEAVGDLFNGAGFAYLPDGPTDELSPFDGWESVQYFHLDGPWHTFTAVF